ncbi:uncharacterized protein DEA37_0007076 [Paragonimus westermani]|uniref:Uncharacterized protein n=1 Tax=Paragonimus westermani TaxID=34504 RepID=A0A5J4NKT2_9TREM|nr:uncharacterized protein DEA37_0007076 [Paragonimus westermani]
MESELEIFAESVSLKLPPAKNGYRNLRCNAPYDWFNRTKLEVILTTLPLTSSSFTDGASVGPVVVKSYEGQRLRRCSPTTTELDEFSASFDHGDVYDSSKAFLVDTKSPSRQSCLATTEDHSVVGSDTGLWDRLMSGWSSTDRRRVPAITKSGTIRFDSSELPILGGHGDELNLDMFVSGNMNLLRDKHSQVRNEFAEAADLSNYRSHNLK